jgi:hypothetical protein
MSATVEQQDDDELVNMRTCPDCGEAYDSDVISFYETENNDIICESCAANYIYSDIQETLIDSSSACTLRGDGSDGDYISLSYRRHNCYQSSENSDLWFQYASDRDTYDDENGSHSDAIYQYHDTDVLDTHGWPAITPKNSLCFGVELEMEHTRDESKDGMKELSSALDGRDGNGTYILMCDGSLNKSGVELITLPYTLEAHQGAFGWDKILGSVKDIGMSGKSTDACGMHVHINRKAISALTLGKMLVFINSEPNTTLINLIAQRNPERWAKRIPKTLLDGSKPDSDKYEALHVSTKTIECRIFKGNMRPDRVLKNIEFCHAMVNYCRDASMQDVTGYNGFLAWINKRRGTYKHLVAFLAESKSVKRLGKIPGYQIKEEI